MNQLAKWVHPQRILQRSAVAGGVEGREGSDPNWGGVVAGKCPPGLVQAKVLLRAGEGWRSEKKKSSRRSASGRCNAFNNCHCHRQHHYHHRPHAPEAPDGKPAAPAYSVLKWAGQLKIGERQTISKCGATAQDAAAKTAASKLPSLAGID